MRVVPRPHDGLRELERVVDNVEPHLESCSAHRHEVVGLANACGSDNNTELTLAESAVQDILAIELIDARRDREPTLAGESRLDVVEEVVADGGRQAG